MADGILAFILRRLEQFPLARLYRTELASFDAKDFDTLRKTQFLRLHNQPPVCSLAPCPVKAACEAPGRDVVQSEGRWWAVCNCPVSDPPIELKLEDLQAFEFNLSAFLGELRKHNQLAGHQAQFTDRTHLVGETRSNDQLVAVVFALLNRLPQSIAILEGLYAQLPSNYTKVVILTPTFNPMPEDAVRLEGRGIVVVAGALTADFSIATNGELLLPELSRTDSPSNWPNEFFKDEDDTWLTARVLSDRYAIPDSRLKDWRESGCPSLAGKKLVAKKVGRVGWVYLRMHVNQIANTRDEHGKVEKLVNAEARISAAAELKRASVEGRQDSR